MAEDAGLFVHEQDVFVLIDDLDLRRADLEIGVFLRGRFKKFVVDVELQDVALIDAVVALCALAVDFYALDADIFLQQGVRQ
mgnify:CR=1 FL=1